MLPANVEEDQSLRDKAGIFKDRIHAGNMLADRLVKYAEKHDKMVVIAIPSGGIPVGHTVAKRLNVALGVILVRKIPIPWETEAGFGSLTLDGSVYLNIPLVRSLGLSEHEIDESIKKAKEGLEQRANKLLAGRKRKFLQKVKSRVAVIVDDGLASGYTMLASVASVKKREPASVIVAVPTGSTTAIELVAPHVDRLLCLNIRSGYLFAVADAYKEWYDVSEEEAASLLMKSSSD